MFNNVVPEILPIMIQCGKILFSWTGDRRQYKTAHGHCMLNTKGYKHKLRICINLLLLHGNNGYTNATRCYVIRTLPVVL